MQEQQERVRKQSLDVRGNFSNNHDAEAEMTKSNQLGVVGLFTQQDPNNHFSSSFHMVNKVYFVQ